MPLRLAQFIDWGTIATILGAIAGWLPTLAIILPIVWWVLKLYKEYRDWDKNDSDPDKL